MDKRKTFHDESMNTSHFHENESKDFEVYVFNLALATKGVAKIFNWGSWRKSKTSFVAALLAAHTATASLGSSKVGKILSSP